jgi:hypothetical protein
MQTISSVLTAITVLAVGVSAHATQFVVNGDFTTLSNGVGQFDTNTTAAGWSSTNASNDHYYNFVINKADVGSNGIYGKLSIWDKANGGNNNWNGLAAGNGNFAALDGAYQNGPLTQTITGLTVGKSYTFSFNYAFSQQYNFNQDTVQHLTETLGGQTFVTSDYNLPEHGFSGWSKYSTTIKATNASEVLSFLAYGNKPVPPFALVSNVSLTAGVPEPATWTMLILGIGGIGAMARRRRAVGLTASALAV